MSWVQTYSGKKFDVLNPRSADVDFRDIAHALSMQARFNGHTSRFYSVAQHCVIMSLAVHPKAALYALLHDAAEAYIGDMPAPVKDQFPEFSIMENVILSVVYMAAGIPFPDTAAMQEVKDYDLRMLITERNQLMGPPPEPWGIDRLNIQPLEINIAHEEPGEHAQVWLDHFDALVGEMKA